MKPLVEMAPVTWTCPECYHRHSWRWPRHDAFEHPITMRCDHCGADTRGRLLVDRLGDVTFEAASAAGRNDG